MLKDLKKRVYQVMGGADFEMNEKGEVALHGRTVIAWTVVINSHPVKSHG